MGEEITFYTNPMSRGRIARWMLEEVGQPYETVLLDFGPAMNTPDYRALNPMGKVPTHRPRRHRRHRVRRDLRLPRRRLPRRRPRARRGASAAPTIAGCSSAPARSKRR